MDRPKRKHRATGKTPPGGKRPDAGRKPGTPNVLAYGETKALKTCRLRVPEGTSEEAADLADTALQRVIDVMNEKVGSFQAGHVLKAATRIREEVCGPIEQRHRVEGNLTITILDPYAEPKDG